MVASWSRAVEENYLQYHRVVFEFDSARLTVLGMRIQQQVTVGGGVGDKRRWASVSERLVVPAARVIIGTALSRLRTVSQ